MKSRRAIAAGIALTFSISGAFVHGESHAKKSHQHSDGHASSLDEPGDSKKTIVEPKAPLGQLARAHNEAISATGIVRGIDKVNGKVKLTHDPVAALGWPRMTMFFRLKDGSLADQMKEGEKVEFSLEKSASGYVISGFQKHAASHDMKQMK
jgi:Cu/Ag efflux protein CusF